MPISTGMRIEASQVDYGVQEAFSQRRERHTSLRFEIRDTPSRGASAAGALLEAGAAEALGESDPRTLLARLVVEALLGGSLPDLPWPARAAVAVRLPARAEQSETPWRITMSQREVHEEKESLAVRARGVVRTAGGTEIRFDAEFLLAREFRMESDSTLSAGNAEVRDPLFLETPQGLALLVTGEGDLFGARTGDGFGELAVHDADSNGWIDEADPLYGQLRLRFEDGSEAALGSLGIGALTASGVAGAFQYKDQANELVAIVRRTGVYLTGDGQAGAIRQIDLAL